MGELPLADTGFGAGQTAIAAMTVPNGFSMYILKFILGVNSNKTSDIFFFKRELADEAAAPYTGGMRIQNAYIGVVGLHELEHKTFEKYPAKTDVGFLAKASIYAEVSCEFEYILVKET